MASTVFMTALSHRSAFITVIGSPVRKLNNVIRGLASLPVTVVPEGA